MSLVLALALALAPAPRKAAPAAQLANRVHRFYAHTKDFSAPFHQRRVSAAFGRVEELSGSVRVKKPNLVRWDYEAPERRSIYVEGRTLWMYFPEDKQAQVSRDFGGDQLSSAFTFLWGRGNLLDEFEPALGRKPDGLPAGDALELTPRKPMAGVERLLFVVGKDGQVLASVATSPQGDTNQIVFGPAKIDQGLDDKLFHFEAPQGTYVQKL